VNQVKIAKRFSVGLPLSLAMGFALFCLPLVQAKPVSGLTCLSFFSLFEDTRLTAFKKAYSKITVFGRKARTQELKLIQGRLRELTPEQLDRFFKNFEGTSPAELDKIAYPFIVNNRVPASELVDYFLTNGKSVSAEAWVEALPYISRERATEFVQKINYPLLDLLLPIQTEHYPRELALDFGETFLLVSESTRTDFLKYAQHLPASATREEKLWGFLKFVPASKADALWSHYLLTYQNDLDAKTLEFIRALKPAQIQDIQEHLFALSHDDRWRYLKSQAEGKGKNFVPMSKEDGQLIRSYTNSKYGLNARLIQDLPLRDGEAEFKESLNRTLTLLPNYRGVTYRRINFLKDADRREILKRYILDSIVEEKGFLSTTASLRPEFSNFNFKIHSKTGKYIAPYSKLPQRGEQWVELEEI
jgi:hypothetical protein